MHPTLRELIELSAKRKWMSYEELNTTLPDEMVDPEKLDELLVLCRRLEVEFVDEEHVRRNRLECFQAPLQTNLKFKRDDPRKPEKKAAVVVTVAVTHKPTAAMSEEEKANAAAIAATSGSDPADEILDDAEAQAVIQEAIADSSSKRIDDPIRMYLTQMG